MRVIQAGFLGVRLSRDPSKEARLPASQGGSTSTAKPPQPPGVPYRVVPPNLRVETPERKKLDQITREVKALRAQIEELTKQLKELKK